MKRILPLLLCALLVVPCIVVPALAAETEYFDLYYGESISMFSDLPHEYEITYTLYDYILTPGLYHVLLYQNHDSGEFLLYDFGIHDFQFVGSDVQDDCEIRFCDKISLGEFDGCDMFLEPRQFLDYNEPRLSFFRCAIASSSSIPFNPEDTFLRFVPVEVDDPSDSSPLSPVRESMSSVLEWVGSVTTSLLSGELEPLLPLLAIPIAISIVMLAIKAVKTLAWGS